MLNLKRSQEEELHSCHAICNNAPCWMNCLWLVIVASLINLLYIESRRDLMSVRWNYWEYWRHSSGENLVLALVPGNWFQWFQLNWNSWYSVAYQCSARFRIRSCILDTMQALWTVAHCLTLKRNTRAVIPLFLSFHLLILGFSVAPKCHTIQVLAR